MSRQSPSVHAAGDDSGSPGRTAAARATQCPPLWGPGRRGREPAPWCRGGFVEDTESPSLPEPQERALDALSRERPPRQPRSVSAESPRAAPGRGPACRLPGHLHTRLRLGPGPLPRGPPTAAEISLHPWGPVPLTHFGAGDSQGNCQRSWVCRESPGARLGPCAQLLVRVQGWQSLASVSRSDLRGTKPTS